MSGAFLIRKTVGSSCFGGFGQELDLVGDHNGDPAEIIKILLGSDGRWPYSRLLTFITATEALLDDPILKSVPANLLVLRLPKDFSENTEVVKRCAELKRDGFKVAYDFDIQELDNKYVKLANYICLDMNRLTGAELGNITYNLARPKTQYIATNVTTTEQYKIAKGANIGILSGNWFIRPHMKAAQKIKPAHSLIIELIDKIKQDADVMELKQLFKRDPDLIHKLLAYINTAGHGFAKVCSIKRAIELLGRTDLYRWLALLLVTDGSDAPQVLKNRAMVHARFAEILAKTKQRKQTEISELFITGAFSLLDAMQRQPMENVLEPINLPDSIEIALLHRQGEYAPFLQLIESAEHEGQGLEQLADQLGVTAEEVNIAHIHATAWLEEMKLI